MSTNSTGGSVTPWLVYGLLSLGWLAQTRREFFLSRLSRERNSGENILGQKQKSARQWCGGRSNEPSLPWLVGDSSSIVSCTKYKYITTSRHEPVLSTTLVGGAFP